ncbi:hypothetical protein MMYC01_207631, partial [Madurella mycetomatis]
AIIILLVSLKQGRVEEQTSTGPPDPPDSTGCGDSRLGTGKDSLPYGPEGTDEFEVTIRESSAPTWSTSLEPGDEEDIDVAQEIPDDDELTVPYESAEDDDGDFPQ